MVEFDENNEDSGSRMNLTGFLFGNIDENGQLEDDILDPGTTKCLGSLSQLGLGSLFNEILSYENEERKEQGKVEETDSDSLEKSPNAFDFSHINELADDYLDESESIMTQSKDYEDHIDNSSSLETSFKIDKSDSLLMPPPLTTSSSSEQDCLETKVENKYETPLASLLPSKYTNIDVTELFPNFRPNKVLRFLKLFGNEKLNNLPEIWRGVRKRKKKRKQLALTDCDSGSEKENRKPKFNGWLMNYGPDPTPEECEEDDETVLLSMINDQSESGSAGEKEKNKSGINVSFWRYGPAQIWFDELKVSETAEGFDYGFKLKEKNNNDDKSINQNEKNEEFDNDAFLMISQLHWEDDICWDKDDAKHKISSKNNTTDWLPPNEAKATQSFNHLCKGPITAVSTNRCPKSSHNQSNISNEGNDWLSADESYLDNYTNNENEELDPDILEQEVIRVANALQTQEINLINVEGPEKDDDNNTWYLPFPVENEELVHGAWEKEIIWDAQNMDSIPQPKILTFDPDDENIIFGIPDDVDPALLHKENRPIPKVKNPNIHVKKSKQLLGKAGVINVLEEDTPLPPPKSPNRDPFNISNDKYYLPKSSETTVKLKSSNLIQHSTPVVELRPPFIETYLRPVRLRNFHRPTIKKYSHGLLSQPAAHSVLPLLDNIKEKAKQREQERIDSGGGDVFFMRTAEDLSGCDGDLILVEFSEEHPPLMNQVGMCSVVKNYYKRPLEVDQEPPKYKYGETTYAQTSPFLGILLPGQSIQAIENNMYRAPIYEHQLPETDFIVIRTRNNYYIREVNALFVAGQECPLYEVPGPHSKVANNFLRDFLLAFIYRLFWKSEDAPRRIRMEEIRKAFPTRSESSIRKRLKLCADFKRTGLHLNWWIMKTDFRLPSEEEIRAMVSPEEYCAYFSMMAAGQRLKDAGYGEKCLFTQQDDGDEETQPKLDDEVKAAPWNTTRAYIQTIKGKCLLQLTGPADPTGCGEGFSYIRVPSKPTISKEEQESHPKRLVTGTDADLRRLPLQKAKELLREFGVPDEEIQKLPRWEVIAVLKTLSTEKEKAGEEGLIKFSRGNRFSIAEHQERYKEECQRIFDLQNRVLSSREVLSSDEGESSAEEEDNSDIEEMGKNIESMLSNKKTISQFKREREEQERQELQRILMNDAEDPKKKSAKGGSKKKDNISSISTKPTRVLKIHRTYRDEKGKEFTRVETVRKQEVIDIYLKIRNSKDESSVKQLASLDEAKKKEIKREKRRIQDRLRRARKREEKEKLKSLIEKQALMINSDPALSQTNSDIIPNLPVSSSSEISNPPSSNNSFPTNDNFLTPTNTKSINDSLSSSSKRRKIKNCKLTCGACGQVGHMKTNKTCPLYQTGAVQSPSVSDFYNEETEQDVVQNVDASNKEDENLVNVDGTKVTISKKVIKPKKRSSAAGKKNTNPSKKRKQAASEEHADFLNLPKRSSNRIRVDPLVKFSTLLESIVKLLKELPDAALFLKPVQDKDAPNYYSIINTPMDLQTITENIKQQKYQNREEFLTDMNQIVENSSLYNEANSPFILSARILLDECIKHLKDKEEELMELEKVITEANYKDEFDSSLTDPNKKVKKKELDFTNPVEDLGFASFNTDTSKKKDLLEEDLQFSSEDEFPDETFGGQRPEDQIGFDQTYFTAIKPVEMLPENHGLQAAEAMTQLGNFNYYVGDQKLLQEDESMDVDPNYDPSEIFMRLPPREDKIDIQIQDVVAVSEHKTQDNFNIRTKVEQSQEEEEIGELWF